MMMRMRAQNAQQPSEKSQQRAAEDPSKQEQDQ
jgi:hypothetical protein